jgi:hypothetical protein
VDIREVTEAFKAMDERGRPLAISKSAILYSVGDGNGFRGRLHDPATVASFACLGAVYYVRTDVIAKKTKPL